MLLAYIDPGSGSLVIQLVIASILAVPFLLRQQIGRVVRVLRREDRDVGSSSSVIERAGEREPPEG